MLSYSLLPKLIITRFRLHLVNPVYNNSSKEKLKEVVLSYLGSNIRNTTSLSHPLKYFNCTAIHPKMKFLVVSNSLIAAFVNILSKRFQLIAIMLVESKKSG